MAKANGQGANNFAVSSPYINEDDRLNRSLNSFATQSFRDQADRDYMAARLACRYELFPQFLWSSQQALEKYLKAILLYNRVPAKNVRHDLKTAISLTKKLPFAIELSKRTLSFIDHLSKCGEFRYIDVPYHVYGYILLDLDLAVWEIRRYCQVLKVSWKTLLPHEEAQLDMAQAELAQSSSQPRYKFRLHNGLLESILDSRKHPSREALLWQNAVYGVRKRTQMRVKHHMHFQNPHLYLYPEMIDELVKYVLIPDNLAKEYRSHLERIKADPKARP